MVIIKLILLLRGKLFYSAMLLGLRNKLTPTYRSTLVYALYYRSFAGKCFLAGMLSIALTLELTGHTFLVQSLKKTIDCDQPVKPNTNGLIMVA